MLTLHAVHIVGSDGDHSILAMDGRDMVIVGTIVRVEATPGIPESRTHYQVDLMGKRLMRPCTDGVQVEMFYSTNHAINHVFDHYRSEINKELINFS